MRRESGQSPASEQPGNGVLAKALEVAQESCHLVVDVADATVVAVAGECLIPGGQPELVEKEPTGLRGERQGGRGGSLSEADTQFRQLLNRRAGGAVVTLSAPMVGSHVVHDDPEHVQRSA
jgi:hypothetical protein